MHLNSHACLHPRPSLYSARFSGSPMGPLVLVLGMVIFFAAHVFTTLRERRAAAIAKIGEGAYKGLYSLGSLAGLVLIASGFGLWRAAGAPRPPVPPGWLQQNAARPGAAG